MPCTRYGPGDEPTWGAPTGHPNDPRTPDGDDALSEAEAREQAECDLCLTPAVLAQWLLDECEGDRAPLTLEAVAGGARPLSVPEVLVLLFNGRREAAAWAGAELRAKFLAANAGVIAERGAELMAAQQQRLQREHDDAQEDLFEASL